MHLVTCKVHNGFIKDMPGVVIITKRKEGACIQYAFLRATEISDV